LGTLVKLSGERARECSPGFELIRSLTWPTDSSQRKGTGQLTGSNRRWAFADRWSCQHRGGESVTSVHVRPADGGDRHHLRGRHAPVLSSTSPSGATTATCNPLRERRDRNEFPDDSPGGVHAVNAGRCRADQRGRPQLFFLHHFVRAFARFSIECFRRSGRGRRLPHAGPDVSRTIAIWAEPLAATQD